VKIYPKGAKSSLEFDVVCNILKTYCKGQLAKELVDQIAPETNFATLKNSRTILKEALLAKSASQFYPFYEYFSIS